MVILKTVQVNMIYKNNTDALYSQKSRGSAAPYRRAAPKQAVNGFRPRIERITGHAFVEMDNPEHNPPPVILRGLNCGY
jgi:hypothetical protein